MLDRGRARGALEPHPARYRRALRALAAARLRRLDQRADSIGSPSLLAAIDERAPEALRVRARARRATAPGGAARLDARERRATAAWTTCRRTSRSSSTSVSERSRGHETRNGRSRGRRTAAAARAGRAARPARLRPLHDDEARARHDLEHLRLGAAPGRTAPGRAAGCCPCRGCRGPRRRGAPRPSAPRAPPRASSCWRSSAPRRRRPTTPVSSSAMAVLRNVACFAVVPLKSNFGFLTAFEPSAPLRNVTCAASSCATAFANLTASPESLPPFDGLGVEGGLEVLEREREVEDVDVAGRGLVEPARALAGSAPRSADAADQGAAAEQGASAGRRHASRRRAQRSPAARRRDRCRPR